VKPLGDPVTTATINIYRAVSRELLPTPSKSHYLFNTRDLAKIIQGMMQVGHALRGAFVCACVCQHMCVVAYVYTWSVCVCVCVCVPLAQVHHCTHVACTERSSCFLAACLLSMLPVRVLSSPPLQDSLDPSEVHMTPCAHVQS